MCPGLEPDPPREAQEKERQPSMFSLAPCRPLVHHLSPERPEDSLVWTPRPLAVFTTNYPSLPFLMSLLQLGVGWPSIKERVKVDLSLSDRSAKAQISSERSTPHPTDERGHKHKCTQTPKSLFTQIRGPQPQTSQRNQTRATEKWTALKCFYFSINYILTHWTELND